MDVLDAKGISWKSYASSAGSIWTAPTSIAHIRNGAGLRKVIIPETGVLSDIQNNQLPPVSWVIPSGANSDHANGNLGTGPAWVASIPNSIGTSAYWKDTAIIITGDDWDGWYDHVAPPHIDNAYHDTGDHGGALGRAKPRVMLSMWGSELVSAVQSLL